MNDAIWIYNRKLCGGCLKSSSIYATDRKVKTKYNNTDTEREFCFKQRYLKLQEVKQKLPAQYEKMVEMIPILHPGHSFFSTVRFADGEKKYRGRITDNFQAFM